MEVLREVNIKKVSNGYILDDLCLPGETSVYKDFAELVNWIAFIFNEIGMNERIELVKKKDETC